MAGFSNARTDRTYISIRKIAPKQRVINVAAVKANAGTENGSSTGIMTNIGSWARRRLKITKQVAEVGLV